MATPSKFLAKVMNNTMLFENAGYYLFSSMLQAKAAILSLYGLFIIFKIQSLSSQIDFIKEILTHNPNPNFIYLFDAKSMEEKEKAITVYSGGYDYRDNRYIAWVAKLRLIEKIKKSILLPLIITIISMIFDGLFIIFTVALTSNIVLRSVSFSFEILSLMIILSFVFLSTLSTLEIKIGM